MTFRQTPAEIPKESSVTDFERRILSYDPFAGDFGDQGDRTFSDKVTTARKSATCHDCAGTIQPKERIRRRVDLADGMVMTFRWCNACCEAMALLDEDGGDAIESRISIGHKIRAAIRQAAE